MATAMRGKEKISDGKEVLDYEMFCDGCAVLREEGQGLGKAERCKGTEMHGDAEPCEGIDKPG